MGIKGMYSYLKPYSHPIDYTKESPLRLGLDVYPFLYKFKHDLDSCIQLFRELCTAGHNCVLYMDGNPPREKLEELAQRRQQRESAYQQAEALTAFLADKDKSSPLDEQARQLIEKQIAAYRVESYSIKKETRDLFIERVKAETNIPIILCQGESDTDLIQASLRGEVDAVIANDMDLFVGGVERLWILGKTSTDPLLLEFRRSSITRQVGLYPQSWVDVAILAGYEKTKSLSRGDIRKAVAWIKEFGSLERLLTRRPYLLQGKTLREFIDARRFF